MSILRWLRRSHRTQELTREQAVPQTASSRARSAPAAAHTAPAHSAAATPAQADPAQAAVGYNPRRDKHLYWLTEDGYIVAQDVTSQYEYVQETPCVHCGGQMKVIAHLNRGGQGLSELVAFCESCHKRNSTIFDISNDVYQDWWAEQLGSLYIKQFDGPPREPWNPQ